LQRPRRSGPLRTLTDSWPGESESSSIEARIQAHAAQGQANRINMEHTLQKVSYLNHRVTAATHWVKPQDPPLSQTPIFQSIDRLGTGTWTRMESPRPKSLKTFNALPETQPSHKDSSLRKTRKKIRPR